MDLVERYLAAVARDLPDRQKADVAAELRDILMSKVEEREAQLGRPLERREVEQMLVDFGHPLTVSGRYRKVQHLIGPEIFPFWWAAVKTSLLIVPAVYVVLAILAVTSGYEREVADKASPSLFGALVFIFGAVTLVCALIERFGKTAMLRRWRPGDLPPANNAGRKQFDILFEALAGVVVIAWWTHLIHFPNTLPARDLEVNLAEVWDDWWWPILAYLVFELVGNLTALLLPGRIRLNAILRTTRNLTGIGIVIGVLQAGHWLDVSGSFTPEVHSQVQANFDRGMHIGLVATLAVFIGLTLWEGWRTRQTLLATRAPAAA